MSEEKQGNKPVAEAKLYDEGNETFRLVASLRVGGIKLEIDKTFDTNAGGPKSRNAQLKTVK